MSNRQEKQETDNPNDSSPPEGSKRWNEIYYQAKKGERAIKELERMRKDYEDLQKMNQETVATIASLSKQVPAKSDSSVNMNATKTSLQKKASQAIKEGDWETYSSINEEIRQLEMESMKSMLSDMKNELFQSIQSQSANMSQEAIVNEFVSSAPWYNEGDDSYNEIMAAAAIGLESKLAKKEPDLRARLTKVKEEIEEKFNWGENTRIPVVGIGGRYRTKNSVNEPVIDPAVEEMAKKFGMDPTDFQKQLNFLHTTKAGGIK